MRNGDEGRRDGYYTRERVEEPHTSVWGIKKGYYTRERVEGLDHGTYREDKEGNGVQ